MLKKFGIILVVICGSAISMAGSYSESGIPMDDASIVSWAVDCNVIRGYIDISDPNMGYVTYGTEAEATGPAEGGGLDVVSLGDGGIATLVFDPNIYITNGEGYDFAVFENGNAASFLELGFVEVSSDGIHFFGFEAVSLTPTNQQVLGFDTLDSTNIYNLAGKHIQGFGTGFDLEELKDVSALLDVNAITHVRIIDVVGYVEPADLYSDGVVNLFDFGVFAAAYGSQVGDENWRQDCDMHRVWVEDSPPYYEDPDGIINLYDLQVFMERWLDENDYSSIDVNGHQINDPWPTLSKNPTTLTYTGGFDLDAVGVINARQRLE